MPALPSAAVPAGVGADVVARDQVARACRLSRGNADAGVAGDDVAAPADAVPPMVLPVGAAGDVDAVGSVAQGGGAGGVGADVVALDQVAGSCRCRR